MLDKANYNRGLRLVLGEIRQQEREGRAVQVESIPSGSEGYNSWVFGTLVDVTADGAKEKDITRVEVGNPCGAVKVFGPGRVHWGESLGFVDDIRSFEIEKGDWDR